MTLAFKRNQVEWALWQLFVDSRPDAGAPPKVFLNRIKRLLDLDRGLGPKDELGFGFAFFDHDGPGLGAEVAYSDYGAFALAVGLDLMDLGFKQAEVVALCRACRKKLQREFRHALARPPAPPSFVLADDRPEGPTYEKNGSLFADCWIFMIMQKIDITEALPEPPKSKGKATLMAPRFARGRTALNERLGEMPHYYRKAFIIELAETAVLVTRWLDQAPLIKRGRR